MDFEKLWHESPALLAFLADNALNLILALLILAIGWSIARWASRVLGRALTRSPHVDNTLVPIFSTVLRYAILAFTLIAVLARFGVQTTSLLAVLGAAGLAIGLALQGTLSNVASGIMLLFLRPFHSGNSITAGGVSGTVQEIGLFTTVVITGDGVWTSVPNGTLWSSTITNFSRSDPRMIDIVLPLDYGADIERAMTLAAGLLDADSRVLKNPAPATLVTELSAAAVNLLVRCWSTSADMWNLKCDLQKELKITFDREGIPFSVTNNARSTERLPQAGPPAA